MDSDTRKKVGETYIKVDIVEFEVGGIKHPFFIRDGLVEITPKQLRKLLKKAEGNKRYVMGRARVPGHIVWKYEQTKKNDNTAVTPEKLEDMAVRPDTENDGFERVVHGFVESIICAALADRNSAVSQWVRNRARE